MNTYMPGTVLDSTDTKMNTHGPWPCQAHMEHVSGCISQLELPQ